MAGSRISTHIEIILKLSLAAPCIRALLFI
jgi:hypothetical protein